MDTRTTLRTLSGRRTQKSRPNLSQAHQLRRRSGGAYLRIEASGNQLAEAIGKHHTTITHRKAGRGPHADLLLELHAYESSGIDATPLIEALIETQLEARGTREAVCPRVLAREEQRADGDEDCAQVDYLSGVPGAGARWSAHLRRCIALQKRLLQALHLEESSTASRA